MTPRPGRLAWIALGLLPVAVAAGALFVSIAGSRGWSWLESRRSELLAEARAQSGLRPVLRGEPAPGDGWEDYRLAMEQVQGLPPEADHAIADDRATRERLLRDHGAAIDALRRGAAREAGFFPVQWEAGLTARGPGLIAARHLAHLAAARATIERQSGRALEAAEILLDVVRFGQDLGRCSILIPEMIGIAISSIALDELAGLVADPSVDVGVLRESARQLEILDSTHPPGSSVLRNELLISLTDCLRWEGTLGSLDAWRYGFSRRWMLSSAAREMDGYIRRLAGAGELDWPAARARLDDVERDIDSSRNRVVLVLMPGVARAEIARRLRRAQLRLVLAAARARSGGRIDGIADPFGDALRHERHGSAIRIWSLGQDGVDDGGSGDFEPSGPDLVLEIPGGEGQ